MKILTRSQSPFTKALVPPTGALAYDFRLLFVSFTLASCLKSAAGREHRTVRVFELARTKVTTELTERTADGVPKRKLRTSRWTNLVRSLIKIEMTRLAWIKNHPEYEDKLFSI